MDYIEYYYKHLQDYVRYKDRHTYAITPESFVERWFEGKSKPEISCADFCKNIEFYGDKEELYMLCCYILAVVDEVYFVKLRPTAKDVNDELDKLGKVSSITFTNEEGQFITVKTESIIKKVVDTVRIDKNDTAYEVDKICNINEVANSTYLQSMFAVGLASFINKYFPVKRKKDSLVNTAEQELILTILHLFKLSPAKSTKNWFRKLLMVHDKFIDNIGWSDLLFDNERRLLPISYIKWKQYNDNNWLDVEYEVIRECDTVTF